MAILLLIECCYRPRNTLEDKQNKIFAFVIVIPLCDLTTPQIFILTHVDNFPQRRGGGEVSASNIKVLLN